MKVDAIERLNERIQDNQAVYGLWVTLESPSITEMAVALGLDWVVIDAEHGHLDWKEIVEHVRAAVRSRTVVLVRISELNGGLIKRALDIGADGVVVPWIETADQLRQAVAYASYPPSGVRGIGAERATCWGQCLGEHVSEANQNVLVVPLIETVRAGRNLREMLKIPGVNLFFFGPHDYSSTAGFAGQWEGPGVAEQLLAMKEMVRSAGRAAGLVATGEENLIQRREQGFQMLGIGLDGGLLVRSIRQVLSGVGRDRVVRASFTLESEPTRPMERPPESMRPDRPEVMNPPGSGEFIELDQGIRFECLVGARNQAKNLTTGIVRFAPLARLAYHFHPFSESITLLEGEALVEVEGRAHVLGKMDNIVVPAGLAHRVRNTSESAAAVFHTAMASDHPTRTLVDRFFSRRRIGENWVGEPGQERVNAFRTSPRIEAGQGATFINYFNSELMPGIEMSGGYGLFPRGARLPAHVHDFDESICIVEGEATCIVEGRRYTMRDLSTALQPRGRVHYFINQNPEPMAMLWVYAGPRPERLVVDERCATAAGDPWRRSK